MDKKPNLQWQNLPSLPASWQDRLTAWPDLCEIADNFTGPDLEGLASVASERWENLPVIDLEKELEGLAKTARASAEHWEKFLAEYRASGE